MAATESARGTVKHLSAPPSLLPLYARAAVTGPLHRGGDEPAGRRLTSWPSSRSTRRT